MKAQIGERQVVIGKRVTVGAAINGVGAVFAHIYPEHAPAIISACVPITFIVQVAIAHYHGVTTKE